MKPHAPTNTHIHTLTQPHHKTGMLPEKKTLSRSLFLSLWLSLSLCLSLSPPHTHVRIWTYHPLMRTIAKLRERQRDGETERQRDRETERQRESEKRRGRVQTRGGKSKTVCVRERKICHKIVTLAYSQQEQKTQQWVSKNRNDLHLNDRTIKYSA